MSYNVFSIKEVLSEARFWVSLKGEPFMLCWAMFFKTFVMYFHHGDFHAITSKLGDNIG